MTEELRIRLLGELELRLGERTLPPLESSRAESLLAYLALHRDAPQPRRRLAFLLWPDSDEPQARTNLRHVLHILRRERPELERFIDAGPRVLAWRPDAPVRVDVAVFEEALARDDLAAAVDAYGGDLLAGSYEEWVLAAREELRERFLGALERLAAALAERGEHAEAIRCAERLVRQDPLRETAYRLLMRLHDARGDRARAIQAYHACAAALERELGAAPSTRTREAYEALLPGAADAEPDRLGKPVFVGRAVERARLRELWHGAAAGRAQLVLVTGEPGIGKTRLVEDLRATCAQDGAVTAEARSYPVEGALTLGPVVAWLRAEPLAARRRRLDGGTLADLGAVLPELQQPPARPPDRRRLFDALARALLVAPGPLLLVADDLPWADRETLRFLHYLLRAAPGARLLVAATARSEDLGALEELTSALGRLERCTEIEPQRLSSAQTAALAERVAGRPLDEAAAGRLHAETEGNPLFIVETLRAGGSLSRRAQAVIESRLGQLSAPARDVAAIAATVGRAFTTGVLERACELPGAELVRALDELWRRGIIRDRGPDAYDFTHDKLREAAYQTLGPAMQRHAHRRVARALEAAGPDDPGAVALHHDRAGDAAAAVPWYERAAEAAQRIGADAEAIRLLERALALATGSEAEVRVLGALLAPLGLFEGFGSARLHQVLRRALELGGGADPAVVRAQALIALAGSEFERAQRLGERLRALGRRDRDPVALVESDYVLGIAAFWQGRLQDARRHFEAADAGYRPEQRLTHVLRYGLDPQVVCVSRLANTLFLLGEPAAAAAARDRALALAAEIDHPATTATALVFAAMLAIDAGDDEGVRRYAAALAGHDEVRAAGVAHRALAGYVDVLDGHADEGLAAIRDALTDHRPVDHAPGHHATLVRVLLAACAVAGDVRGGLDATEIPVKPRVWAPLTARMRAAFLAEERSRNAADAIVARHER